MSKEPIIGTLQEGSLHSSLKELYLDRNAKAEVLVDGYVVDIVKDGLLIEIQTSNFAQIKNKLLSLFANHPVRLVHPLSQKKWIVKQSLDGTEQLSRRLSPKKCGFEDIFDELVRIPSLISHPNFSLESILIEEEEIRRQDGLGSWRRRGWSIVDRRLVNVIDRRVYEKPSDFLHFIPDSLARPFTTSDLVEALGFSKQLAQRLTYCLRKMNVLKKVGKSGNAILHEVV
ncbi:MAG: hypothetical protein AM325_015130 [Candidatus Thorarchaeota archaeon SMTZ1-45]|nr:MAG: hypothetical protein AM325_16465 [Candidatus Thorarchaeota archaeon SMTZ1-45]